jgi:integrase/recombinase XerD
MSTLAPILQSFFTDRLQRQRQASTHTIAAYRDAIRLLVVYAADQTAKAPSAMDIADLDAPLIGAFLNHLEADRHNRVRTRNVRLAAVHSLFRHAALHRPDDAAIIQRVLAIPPKRFDRTLVTYLTEEEISALLAAPDRGTWTGPGTDSVYAYIQLQYREFDARVTKNGQASDLTGRYKDLRGFLHAIRPTLDTGDGLASGPA